MTLGQRIQEHRARLGLSQESLGEQLGVSRQAVSKWEADASLPDTDKLIALAKLFGLSLNQLLQVDTASPEPPEAASPSQITPAASRPGLRLSRFLAAVCLLLAAAVVWQGILLFQLRRQVEQLTSVAVPPPQIAHFLWSARRDDSHVNTGDIHLAFQVQAKNLHGQEAQTHLLLTDGAGQTYRLEMERTNQLWFRGGAVVSSHCPVTVSVALTAAGEEAVFPLIQLDSLSSNTSTYTPLYDLEAISETSTAWLEEYDQWVTASQP